MRTSWVRSLVQHPRARFMRRSLRRMFLGIWPNFLLMPYIASVPANMRLMDVASKTLTIWAH